MGHIKVREKVKGSGVWWLFYNRRGERWSQKVGTKREAKMAAEKLEPKALASELGFKLDSKKTFGWYCDDWLEHIPGKLKASTVEDYHGLVRRHFRKSKLWSTPISQITKKRFQDFIDKKRAGLSASSCSHIKHVASNVFNRAIDDEIIKRNPTKRVTVGIDQEEEAEKESFVVYSEEEFDRLLDVFRGTRHYCLILFFCRTGCRASEVAALEWRDVNLKEGEALIRRGLVRGKISTPKGKRKRTIDLADDLCDELRRHRQEQLASRSATSRLVFQNTVGKYLDLGNFKSRTYDKKLAEAGLAPSRLHDLRHSFASQLLKETGDVAYISKQLGHRDAAITLQVYTHAVGTEKLVNKLGGNTSDRSGYEKNG